MRLLAGIYGFDISHPISYRSWRIEPITASGGSAHSLATDLDAYNLTATLIGESLPEDARFKLEGVLSFIEHLDVVVVPATQLIDDAAPAASQLPTTLRLQRRNSGGGAVIGRDAFFQRSRSEFVALAMDKLSDIAFRRSTKFDTLLFKCVETFRQRSPFLEIAYFLLFSGLESFARASLDDKATRNASKPIYKLLQTYGLSVLLDDATNLPRSIATYTRLRNSLFHNSEFKLLVQIAGSPVLLDASAHLFHLSMLVSITIMKAVGFDDGHTNWDAWIDRQLHR